MAAAAAADEDAAAAADEDAASDLLESLHSSVGAGIYDRFASFLLPFGDFIPLHSHNPNSAAPTKIGAATAAPKKRGAKKKASEPDLMALRPIAKRFLSFLCQALKILPSLLRKSPKTLSSTVDDQIAAELLGVYRLLLDCLACIGPCLAGKAYSVHLQKGHLLFCLEAWERYAEAEEEALVLLENLRLVLVEAAPVPKSRKGKISSSGCYLPDPALVGTDDPDVTTLVITVITVLVASSYKSKNQKEVVYDRILALIDQVQPWLRFLNPEGLRRFQNLLDIMCRCSLFLLEEYRLFKGDMVHHFCLRTLKECANSSPIDHFYRRVGKVSSSVDLQWDDGSSLLLDILRLALQSILCSCKVNLLNAIDEFLEIVSHFARRICISNLDICRSAAELLCQGGGDTCQVSLPLTSILTLYSIGLHFKFSCIQANQSTNGVDLQNMSFILEKLANCFDIINHKDWRDFSSEIEDTSIGFMTSSKSGTSNSCMQTHGKVSFISYIEALEFPCKQMVEFVSIVWKKIASAQEPLLDSDGLNYLQKALHQICDLFLDSTRCSVMSKSSEQRLVESQGTLLQIALSSFKISLIADKSYEKSLLVINGIISSTQIEMQELKFLISSINNVGAVCYNSGWLEKASKAFQLCLEITWKYVRFTCSLRSSNSKKFHSDNIDEDGHKDAINDALTRISKIIGFLHKYDTVNIKDIIVKSLYEFSAAAEALNDTGISTLMHQWVKILCEEFKDVHEVDNAPILYYLLLDCGLNWSKKIIGKILEQELNAYEVFKSHNPNLCQKMELKIMDLLLNNVYTSKDYNLQKSSILVRKGKCLRALGTEGINKCLECLSEAVFLLRFTYGEASQVAASVAHQLALTCLLYAQCAQEANQDSSVILDNVQCALSLWSGINIEGCPSTSNNNECPLADTLPILCTIVDLLSLKGCLKFQIKVCKLIIKFCMSKNVPLEQCITMLWTNRRLNHSLCRCPIHEGFVFSISEKYDLNADSLDYWISCMKGDQPTLCTFLQKLLPTDCHFSEPRWCSVTMPFGAQMSIQEVEKVASSLISKVPLTSESTFMASYLYYDLSERLFSNGRFIQALFYARKALCLRDKLFRRKFIYKVTEQSAKTKLDQATQSTSDRICLEAVSNAITDVWLGANKSGNSIDSFHSVWGVLRCYLESTLQVGVICESTGNGADAEHLFRIGKEISCLRGFPVLAITFTIFLGQLYCRKQCWDMAANEIDYAKKLLVDYDHMISCDRCKMSFEVMIDMQAGDLSRNILSKRMQTKCAGSLPDALGLYRSALGKLEQASVRTYINVYQKPGTYIIGEARNSAQHHTKMCSTNKGVKLPVCSTCLSLSSHTNVPNSGQGREESDELRLLDNSGLKSNAIQVKKTSKKSFKSSEKDLSYQTKPRRNRSTAKTINVVNTSTNFNGSVTLELKLSKGHYKSSEAACGSEEECGCNKIKCWRCLILLVVESGFMQDILYLKWESYSRHLKTILLIKIAKCLGTHSRKHGDHEVHEVFGRCISVMFNWKSFRFYGTSDSSLIHLLMDESLGDFFRMERAAVLYNMSWFCLKNCTSENPRTNCCSFSKIQMTTICTWLLNAFILCRENPLLFHKVSRLLSLMFLFSTIDCSASLPVQTEKSLSLNHWAAYFHQASVGTNVESQYFNSQPLKVFSDASMMDDTAELSKFLRFFPDYLEDLEEHVCDFFKSLPNIPIICISLLGGDYTNLIGEMLFLPSFFPAWMLVSRLVANNQPVVMLLPVNLIEEDQLEVSISCQKFSGADAESAKQWSCPWDYSVVDCVLPSFRKLLEENFLFLFNSTFSPADTQTKFATWWSQRIRLDNCLNKLLRNIETSWLGPWGCLLLGEHSSIYRNIDRRINKLINALKSHCKRGINYSLISSIIGGSKSIIDAESCIHQLILYNGYFGRGACCGQERFRVFPAAPETEAATNFIHDLVREMVTEYGEHVDREPVILVLDSDVQMLPWENIPILRNQEVYRMPSIGSIFATLGKSCSHHKKDEAFGTIIPAVDPVNAYYLLNPSGDLNDTQVEFEHWFRSQEWEGKAGVIPTVKELSFALQNRDLFLYFGHGSGTQYMPEKEIRKLDHCAATLLMGCSSGALVHKGCYAPQGAPLSYLLGGSPCVIANLWDVTDKDIDRFGKALLNSWLLKDSEPLDNCTRDGQLVKELSCMNINKEVTTTSVKTRRKQANEKLQNLSASKQGCRRNRIVSFMSQARESCRLPMLIGAAPVCYGVPTVIWKKLQSES